MHPRYAYLFFEISLLLLVLLLTLGNISWKKLVARDTLSRAGVLFVLWLLLDQAALAFDIWNFPEAGSLPIRIAGLPMEEYFLFLLHTLITLMLTESFTPRESPAARPAA